jgi:hypothetical protein
MDRDAPGSQRDVFIPECFAERSMQIGSMQVVERRAPAGNSSVTERDTAEEGAGLPITRIKRKRSDAMDAERIGESQSMEHFDCIGTERNACTNLAQDAALLIDMNVKAGVAQCHGSR